MKDYALVRYNLKTGRRTIVRVFMYPALAEAVARSHNKDFGSADVMYLVEEIKGE